MDKKFLTLTPTYYLCPFCGKWHEWPKRVVHELGYYNSNNYPNLRCYSNPSKTNFGNYTFYFCNEDCYYSMAICHKFCKSEFSNIPISSINESLDEPVITFEVQLSTDMDVGYYECSDCNYKTFCNYAKLGDAGDNRHLKILLGFKFEKSDYEAISKAIQSTKRNEKMMEHENALSFQEQELNVQKSYINAKCNITKQQEEISMSNIFNMNEEFGPNKDPNLSSTLMGIAVKSKNNWRIYDQSKKEIIDVGNIQLGNFPIFIMPSTTISEGDLIKDADDYYFVMKIENESTQTICAKTGEMKKVIPIKNILGSCLYSKVVTIDNTFNVGENLNIEKLIIMSAMCGNNDQSPCQVNQLLPILLFKDKLGNEKDMIKMFLISNMMNGNSTSTNAMMNYLMMSMFMDKTSLKQE